MRDVRRYLTTLRMLGTALFRGLLTAHLAGVILLCLVVAIEATDEPPAVLLQTVRARVPELWAAVSAVLGMAGVAVTVTTLRRQGVVIGLGTIGVRPMLFVLVGALCAGTWGFLSGAVSVPPAEVPGAWERGDQGWIRGEQAWPDHGGAAVRRLPPPARSTPVDLVNLAAAGACGAAVGLWGGPMTGLLTAGALLVVDVVALGLTGRAVLPPAFMVSVAILSILIAVGLWLRSPLFPRRWG